VPHDWKNTGTETGRVLFLNTPARAGGFFEEQLRRPAGGQSRLVSSMDGAHHFGHSIAEDNPRRPASAGLAVDQWSRGQ
jgi:hypothetical protein